MELLFDEKSHYLNLKKGFEGELIFDDWVSPLLNERLILNDLLFLIDHNYFQIDSLWIRPNTITLFEIKNFEGDFSIEGDKWYALSNQTEIKNPLFQLKRNETLLRRLLQKLGVHITIEPYLVFVNPDFHLYHSSPSLPIIYPTQLKRFVQNELKKSEEFSSTHTKLSNQLLQKHITNYPHTRLPHYSFDQLKKGILCPVCLTFYSSLSKNYLICKGCRYKEEYKVAVLRQVEELKLLFPTLKITTSNILEWCSIIKCRETIQIVLSRNMRLYGHGKSSYNE